MKRTIFWLLTMLVTFSLGVVTAFIWLSNYNPTSKTSETISPTTEKGSDSVKMPILSYCELANNPEKYDGQIVRINGRLVRGMHGIKFYSPNCYAKEKEAALVIDEQIWEALENAERDVFSTFVDKPAAFNFFEVTVVGKFSRVTPSRTSDHVLDNSHLQFKILEIEKASKQ